MRCKLRLFKGPSINQLLSSWMRLNQLSKMSINRFHTRLVPINNRLLKPQIELKHPPKLLYRANNRFPLKFFLLHKGPVNIQALSLFDPFTEKNIGGVCRNEASFQRRTLIPNRMEKWFKKRTLVPLALDWGLVSVHLIVPHCLEVEAKGSLNTPSSLNPRRCFLRTKL